MAESRETRKWHSLAMHSSRARDSRWDRGLKMLGTGAAHPSTSIVDVCFRGISAVLPRFSTYVRTYRDVFAYSCLETRTFPRLATLLSLPRRTRRENAIPERPTESFNDFFQRQFSTSSIIFHDIVRQVVYRSSLVDCI